MGHVREEHYGQFRFRLVEENEDFAVAVEVYVWGESGNLDLWRNGFCLGSCWNPAKRYGSTRNWFNRQVKHHKSKEKSLVKQIEELQQHLACIRSF